GFLGVDGLGHSVQAGDAKAKCGKGEEGELLGASHGIRLLGRCCGRTFRRTLGRGSGKHACEGFDARWRKRFPPNAVACKTRPKSLRFRGSPLRKETKVVSTYPPNCSLRLGALWFNNLS